MVGAPAAGQEETVTDDAFTLTGTVADGESGVPVLGAAVGLGDSRRVVLTDDLGKFSLSGLRSGLAVITVSRLGYADLAWEGEIRPGGTLNLELTPKPVLLEGIEVVADRFRSRRKASAISVRVIARDDLAMSPYFNVLDVMRAKVRLFVVACRDALAATKCVLSRGRAISPSVYVDEMPVPGGMQYLEMMSPHELELLEVYGGGRHIRAYTTQFMKRAAERRLFPVPLWWS